MPLSKIFKNVVYRKAIFSFSVVLVALSSYDKYEFNVEVAFWLIKL